MLTKRIDDALKTFIPRKDYELKREKDRQVFIEKFPLKNISKLTLEEFVSGNGNKESFCYWLEFKDIMFGIGGGNASKFGIYKSKVKGGYCLSANKNSKVLSEEELPKYFNKLKSEIISALDLVSQDKIYEVESLKTTSIWNIVLLKILAIYYPNKFLHIGSLDTLKNVITDLELNDLTTINEKENIFILNYKLKRVIDSWSQFQGWGSIRISDFIWATYENKLKNNYYLLGSKYSIEGKYKDVSKEMIEKGVVSIGFALNHNLSEYYGKAQNDITSYLKSIDENKNSYNALKYFLNLKVGDRIAIKSSGSPKGKTGNLTVIGYATVIEKDGIIYTYDKKSLGHMIYVKHDMLENDINFELGGYGSTIHKLSNKEHINKIFYSLRNSKNDFQQTKVKFEKPIFNNFITYLRKIISELKLKPNDDRVVYSVRENRLNFTVGQRYSFNLYLSDSRGSYGVISKNKLNSTSEPYEGDSPQPFYSFLNDFNPDQNQWESIIGAMKDELNKTNMSGYKRFNNIDFENYVFEIYSKQKSDSKTMNLPLNTILYGPPGTGKTYILNNEYVKLFTSNESSITKQDFLKDIIQNCSWWQVIALAVLELGKTKVADIYKHEYVQIKAQISNSTTVTPTIWGQLQSHTIEECENVKVQRRMPPFIFNKTNKSEWEILENEVEEQSPELLELKSKIDNFDNISHKKIKRFEFITFHQSYSYEDFIEGIKPELSESDIAYSIQPGVFQELCNRARNDLSNNYAIFIDEINRGNISSIFGELITLIEEDKREGMTNEIKATLPYSKKPFSVPSNLYIIGTMNTADRSVEALDTALRRRFSFIEMNPKPEILSESDFLCEGINLDAMLNAINGRIEKLLDKDYCIGHSYFLTIKDKENPEGELREIFQNKILPLLQEYFYGDWGKIQLILGKNFVDVRKDTVTFLKTDRDEDFEEYVEKPVYYFTNPIDWTLNTFKSIYE
jgi:Cdc6-like AAA superfamily ATPase